MSPEQAIEQLKALESADPPTAQKEGFRIMLAMMEANGFADVVNAYWELAKAHGHK